MWFFKLVSFLPFSVLYVLSDTLRFVLFKVARYRKDVVKTNLRHAFPEKSEKEIEILCADFYRNLCDVIVETIKSISITKYDMLRHVGFTNPDLPLSFLDNGKSFMTLSSHQCNWEWLLLACSAKFPYPIDAVYRPLHNSYFDKFMLSLRSKFGAYPVPMAKTMRELINRRDIVRSIAMVADQTPHPGDQMYITRLFGQDTSFFRGANKISEKADLPVMYVEMVRVKRGFYEVTFHLIAKPPF